MRNDDKLVLALPKGRILTEALPLLARAGIVPEAGFDADDDRRLRFDTNIPNFSIVTVRSFDVATFVAFGAAELGVAAHWAYTRDGRVSKRADEEWVAWVKQLMDTHADEADARIVEIVSSLKRQS